MEEDGWRGFGLRDGDRRYRPAGERPYHRLPRTGAFVETLAVLFMQKGSYIMACYGEQLYQAQLEGA